MSGPLEGIKVLDLSRFIAGPHAGMLLADMGAEVIKVERPKIGEETRAIHPQIEGESLYVQVFNRNKKGLTLNYRDPRAQEILRDLAGEADVLLENFRVGTMEKMGCGWDVLHARNPRLVMARVSGFGQDGPYAERPCFDVIAQAMSGLMEITGQEGGPPTMAGTFVVDYVTALHATIAIQGALHARERTGRGQLIDVALLDSAISLLMTAIPEQVLLGRPMTRRGNRDRYAAPCNVYQAKDGAWVQVLAANDSHFGRFVQAAGLARLLDDPRFATNAVRMEHVEAIEAEVAAWVGAHTAEEALALCAKAGVPAAKVATIADVVADPHLQARGQIAWVDHWRAGRIPMQGVVARLSETPMTVRHAAPSIGQHSREVLTGWLGLTGTEIDALARDGVI